MGPMSLLLVDDEEEFVQILAQRLRQRGVAADIVFSGELTGRFTDRVYPSPGWSGHSFPPRKRVADPFCGLSEKPEHRQEP